MEVSKNKRLKVLLCCYACDPSYGSEPGMGWNFAYHISRFHDAHVLVEEKFKENLLNHAKKHPEDVKNITFHFIKKQRHRTLRKIWPPSYYWFYRQWHKKAYRYAIELDKRENFDLIHQITLATYREPGYLWKIKKPFIWGPFGGMNHTSWKLVFGMGIYRAAFYAMRNLINSCQKRWGYAATTVAPRAHAIITCNSDFSKEIVKHWQVETHIIPEVGITPITENLLPSKKDSNSPIEICWAGVLEPRKSLDILLKAISICNSPIHINVLGNGPCFKKWQKLAKKLNLEDRVTFHGRLPHEEVYKKMKESDIFCITSISEGGTTTVVAEALRMGLPIIALDHCGFSSAINEKCGIKIPIISKKQIISDYARYIDFLASDADARRKLSEGAIERSKIFSWEEKMARINNIYTSIESL